MKARLRDATDAAVREGVWGVPTFAVDGELFWGFDDLAYLELFLAGRDPLQPGDAERFTAVRGERAPPPTRGEVTAARQPDRSSEAIFRATFPSTSPLCAFITALITLPTSLADVAPLSAIAAFTQPRTVASSA